MEAKEAIHLALHYGALADFLAAKEAAGIQDWSIAESMGIKESEYKKLLRDTRNFNLHHLADMNRVIGRRVGVVQTHILPENVPIKQTEDDEA